MESLTKINFQNIKSVGIRVDFNVPIDENFVITDTTRLLRAAETIKFIKEKNCKILLISHFGRPKDNFETQFSFQNLIEQFSKILNEKINLILFDNFSKKGLSHFKQSEDNIFLLDNIRFFKGEKTNDMNFSKSITDQLDLYINEAFSASHRSHASVNQMAKNILSLPGFNFEKEIIAINEIKNSSKKKLAIIGGSKVSTKIDTLLSLTQSCSNIFIGGAMANNFLKFKGISVGESLLEADSDMMIEEIYDNAKKSGCEIHLPLDVVTDKVETFSIDKLSSNSNFKILDLFDSSINLLDNLISKSEIVLWNGPMGMIENENFSRGSSKLASLLSHSSSQVVIGGGDTLLAINIAGINFDQFYFVSTAGGAFLEALEDKVLPGVEALNLG
ncbi:phosphoglycerate kinase [Alphaproteobacteria bacterium]|nr:phosphoglycerate kinase [Alphaproteobacteria bacterium]MDB3974088.1 phosphoglycerate kinase [Alphaproteobacteria bacterium]